MTRWIRLFVLVAMRDCARRTIILLRGTSDMGPRLVFVSGPISGSTVYLTNSITCIGRQPSNTVHLDDLDVSRKHCLIRREGGRFVVEDIGSKNGTYLNGERVRKSGLKEGSHVQVGGTQFLFWLREFEELVHLSPITIVIERYSSP